MGNAPRKRRNRPTVAIGRGWQYEDGDKGFPLETLQLKM